jgi:hypothetical protein
VDFLVIFCYRSGRPEFSVGSWIFWSFFVIVLGAQNFELALGFFGHFLFLWLIRYSE